MNFLERFGLKLVWKRFQSKLPWIRRWVPILGGLLLIASSVLKMVGNGELAETLLQIGSLLNITQGSPISTGEAAQVVAACSGAAALLWGIIRKFRSSLQKKG